MNERSEGQRSEGQGAIVIVMIGFVVLLFLAGGAGVVVFVRQQTLVNRERDAARAAEMQARMFAELARVEISNTLQNHEESADLTAAEPAARGAESASITPTAFDSMPIVALLTAQATAWNAGDLDAFMEHYWHSDDLTFSSTGETTRGWSATLNRYRTKYPNREAMGTLKFDSLEFTPLGEAAALVLGRWQLDRANVPLEGNFSLVLRRIDNRWQIIHDHTSLLPAR